MENDKLLWVLEEYFLEGLYRKGVLSRTSGGIEILPYSLEGQFS
jgi:hypothetical protein